LEWFSAAVHERIDRVARARATLGNISTSQAAVLGDNRRMQIGLPVGGFDAVITSPPYETALPYIDTQRLSLVLLGHISPQQILATEQELIGCRDISLGERREIESQIAKQCSDLPREVVELCRELLSAATAAGNGFRRRNRPALTFRYFRNMLAFFEHLRPLMRPGGKVALVVGPSRTTLAGKEYVIETPRLLASIGRQAGYGVELMVAMDTYQRFDLHRRNAIQSEALLVLTSPGR
jgi:site-specific DNA-methyltransferase (cytosine-N4-specific)